MMEDESKVDLQAVIKEWNTARQNRQYYTTDFVSLDNLVNGVPLNHEENAPYVGDTTLAGLVRSIPRQSLQQLPIFAAKINGSKKTIRALVATFLLSDKIFNENTFGKGLLSTVQMAAEQALTHGYAPSMPVVGKVLGDFGTSMKLMHYDDVDPEPGISDANEGGYFYVSANLTPTRVRKILRAAENNTNTSWNIEALEQLLEIEPATKNYSIYQSAVEQKNQNDITSHTYQFVTRYETGKGAQFITFCPQIQEIPLRVITSKSRFGYPRIQFLVIDPTALSPFGLSRVRLASPNQNLANIFYGNIAAMLLLNSKPPLLKRGRFTKPVQLKQGAVWEALDQNAKVELKAMDNGALGQFVPMIQQLAAQIQNMMGLPTGTVNANSNNFGFSKTGPGVRQQDRVIDLAANQITNILENFLRQYALVALDTYISEQTSEPDERADDVLILDDETKNAINRIVPETVGTDNALPINWNEYYAGIKSWSVEIELSISKDELEDKKRADLQDTLTVLGQNAQVLGPGAVQKVQEITDMLLEKTVPEAKRLEPSAAVPYAPQTLQPPQA